MNSIFHVATPRIMRTWLNISILYVDQSYPTKPYCSSQGYFHQVHLIAVILLRVGICTIQFDQVQRGVNIFEIGRFQSQLAVTRQNRTTRDSTKKIKKDKDMIPSKRFIFSD